MCKEGETISEEEIERQIQGTEYMKWMAKNQEEHEIVEAMQDEIDNNLTPVVTMNNINAELGYNMFCVQRENGQDVVKRMKDTMMGNNDDDLPFAFELTYENFAKRYRYDNSKKKQMLEETTNECCRRGGSVVHGIPRNRILLLAETSTNTNSHSTRIRSETTSRDRRGICGLSGYMHSSRSG